MGLTFSNGEKEDDGDVAEAVLKWCLPEGQRMEGQLVVG
jgi:hypothetical protein